MISIFLFVESGLVKGLPLYSLPTTRSMKNAENITLCQFILTAFEKISKWKTDPKKLQIMSWLSNVPRLPWSWLSTVLRWPWPWLSTVLGWPWSWLSTVLGWPWSWLSTVLGWPWSLLPSLLRWPWSQLSTVLGWLWYWLYNCPQMALILAV